MVKLFEPTLPQHSYDRMTMHLVYDIVGKGELVAGGMTTRDDERCPMSIGN